MSDCVFCGIVGKTIPADIVYEDEQVVAFPDIKPLAPTHYLVIPKQHHPTFEGLEDSELMNHLLTVAKKLGAEHSADSGYRILINSGQQAEIPHLHVHVVGGLRPDQALSPRGGDDA